MPAPGLTLSIKLDDAKARAAIHGIYLRTLSLRVPFNALGKWLVTRQHEHFEKQESPTGVPWKALAPSTIARRTKGYASARSAKRRAGAAMSALFGEKILFVHGYLEQSVTYRADDTTLAVGSDRKTAAIHQLGGTPSMRPGPAHIPARPYLGMNGEDENRGSNMMMEHLAAL